MTTELAAFLQAARRAGLRVSVSESLDAAGAVAAVGFDDRALVHDALATTLAKTIEEQQLFDECFDRFFARAAWPAAPAADGAGPAPGNDETDLVSALRADDRAALAAALERAAARAQLGEIRLFTQVNLFVRRILDELGEDALLAALAQLRAGDDADARMADRLEAAAALLRERVRTLVERRLQLRERENARQHDDIVRQAPLGSLDRRDRERVRAIVRAMAKRLATRYGRTRRRRRRGTLDVRATLRRNALHGGVPFLTVWKRRVIRKPRIVVLCDVSGSVSNVAQLLLVLLYGLTEAIADIRAFAFSSHLIEVSAILESANVDDAIATIVRDIGFRSSDYGRSLADFSAGWLDRVDRRTSVVIMGDARSNYNDPRVDVLRTLYVRAKRVVWLNPEPALSWGTGDSEMLRYRPYCHVVRTACSARDLERSIGSLLRDG